MVVDGRREVRQGVRANRPETRTYRMVDGKRIGLLREVRLDARLAVEVEAQGKGTRVTADAVYVLTKAISRVFKGGQPGEALDHEMMSFTSAEIGRFRKGTSCIATGKLEDLPTQGLKKVTALPSGGAEPAPPRKPRPPPRRNRPIRSRQQLRADLSVRCGSGTRSCRSRSAQS